MAPPLRDEFRNDSGGWLGVVTITPRGDRVGTSVPPGDTVWLSEEEQIETANAPRSEADNPFVNGQLVLVTSGHEVKNRRPLRPDDEGPVQPATPADTPPRAQEEPPPVEDDDQAEADEDDETGATPEPDGEPEEGEYAEGEEVATPDAASRPKPHRRRRAAAAAAG